MGQKKVVTYPVVRLTEGPAHHLFGFHDLKAWNAADDKLLALEVETINRPPLPGETFTVGYVRNGHFRPVGRTEALNYPQGARQQWVGRSELFCVNNRVGKSWGTDLYDTDKNILVDRFAFPTHALSVDGRYSYGLDYARLFRLGGYGYSGIADTAEHEALPERSGITVQDLRSKETRLLVSVSEAAACGAKHKPGGTFHHYLTHLALNPSSTRLAFLHRYFMPDGGMMTRLMTIGADGTELRCLAQGFLSHFDWKDDETIYIFGRANSNLDALRANPLLSSPVLAKPLRLAKRCVKTLMSRSASGPLGKSFLLVTDARQPVVTPFAQGVITEDGHPMTCPVDNDWCINDTYPDADGIRTLMLYRFSEDKRIDLGRFRMSDEKPDMTLCDSYLRGLDARILRSVSPEQLSFTRSGLHCDLHPRWNQAGTRVAFDSIHEGSRQIYAVDLINILK